MSAKVFALISWLCLHKYFLCIWVTRILLLELKQQLQFEIKDKRSGSPAYQVASILFKSMDWTIKAWAIKRNGNKSRTTVMEYT